MKKNHLLKNLLLINFSFLFLCCCKNQLSPKSLFSENEGEQERYSDFSGEKKSRVSIACWNVQTFFDAVSDGNEYTDFKNSSKWTKEKYVKRLSKLCEVMTMLNSDDTFSILAFSDCKYSNCWERLLLISSVALCFCSAFL